MQPWLVEGYRNRVGVEGRIREDWRVGEEGVRKGGGKAVGCRMRPCLHLRASAYGEWCWEDSFLKEVVCSFEVLERLGPQVWAILLQGH